MLVIDHSSFPKSIVQFGFMTFQRPKDLQASYQPALIIYLRMLLSEIIFSETERAEVF